VILKGLLTLKHNGLRLENFYAEFGTSLLLSRRLHFTYSCN